MNNRTNRNHILWYDTMIVSLLKTQIIKLKKKLYCALCSRTYTIIESQGE